MSRQDRNDPFARRDLTLMLCSHSRAHCLPGLLERLTAQDYEGNVEVILWNNNYADREILDAVVDDFAQSLDIRLIHSRNNYYCAPRLAAPALMRSDMLLVCDDDVLPEPGYIRGFLDAYRELGPEAVLGATGHIFLPLPEDDAAPEEVIWRNPGHRLSLRQKHATSRVHFLHANNYLVPRSVLSRLATHTPPSPDFVLVDDYWMSYVLDHVMGVPLYKIQSDHLLTFDPSADDPERALWLNPEVVARKLAFCAWHLARGWPDFSRDLAASYHAGSA